MSTLLNAMSRFGLWLCIALVWASTLSGQTGGGSLSGSVRDQGGAALPGASVTITNVDTGGRRVLVADEDGRYTAPSLAVGLYEIKAAKEGFASQIRTGIQLTVGQSAIVDLTLAVGGVRQEVTVIEVIPPVNLSTQETSGLVNERQLKDLPLNGRSYDQLLTLNPGIVNYTSQRAGGQGTNNSVVGNMFAASGRRPQENLYILNGVEFTSASEINNTPGGASGQLLGVDAVREFQVVKDTYGAEYGKRPGAQVNIVTDSGGNQLRGNVYEFLRNSALDARNYFDQGNIPQFQRNQFGGAVGGPIRKDRAFVFANYEGFRQNLGLSDVTLVPDNGARSGNITPLGSACPGAQRAACAAEIQSLLTLWPVQNGQRGIPDAAKSVTDRGPRVFETYKAQWEVFHPDGSAPAPWDQYDANNPCGATVGFGDMVLASFSKFSDLGQAGFGSLVGPLVAQPALGRRLLRAHVAQRADQVSTAGHSRIVARPGQSEVGNPDIPRRVEKKVRGLDIPMYDAELVGMFESFRCLDSQSSHGLEKKGRRSEGGGDRMVCDSLVLGPSILEG